MDFETARNVSKFFDTCSKLDSKEENEIDEKNHICCSLVNVVQISNVLLLALLTLQCFQVWLVTNNLHSIPFVFERSKVRLDVAISVVSASGNTA